MMDICEEMQKLRNKLDELGTEWIDNSNERICGTIFKVGRKKWSVVNGFGTYGGYSGLLEVWDGTKKNEPVGFLTAQGVLKVVKLA